MKVYCVICGSEIDDKISSKHKKLYLEFFQCLNCLQMQEEGEKNCRLTYREVYRCFMRKIKDIKTFKVKGDFYNPISGELINVENLRF